MCSRRAKRIENNNEETRDLEKLRSKASEKIRKAQEYNEEYVNKKRKPAYRYNSDDLVMIRNFETGPEKLAPAYKGPYKIIKTLRNDRYVIDDIEGFQMSQKPYTGVWEAAHLKPYRDKKIGKRGDTNTDNETESESDTEETSDSEKN